jgi:hypothetical protein
MAAQNIKTLAFPKAALLGFALAPPIAHFH